MSNPQQPTTVAQAMVRQAHAYRLWTLILGIFVSFALIIFGYLLTQGTAHDIKPNSIDPNEFSAKGGGFELIAKNTAPGITFILCGTLIFVVTVNRKFFAKTQWNDDKHPGYTEVNY